VLSFEYAWAAALIPLPLLVYFALPRATQQQAALRVPFFSQLIADSSAVPRYGRPQLRVMALLVWWLLLVAAAAGPQWVGEEISLPASGRDLLLAVDISGSMQIRDMQLGDERVQRLVAVKAVVNDFIRQRKGDRIGLIVFGSQAYVHAPLTFDTDTVGRFLREAQIGFAGEETAIGDAIGLAIKRLRERPGQRHVVVLLTDGASNAGAVTPTDAARLAAQNGIVVYTIGVGADELVIPGPFGTGFGARRVNPSQDLDEETLRAIADTTGGRYFRARDPQELAEIYRLLDQIEPIADDAQTYRPRRTLFHWPLAAALLLSLAVAGSRAWRGRRTAATAYPS